MVETPRNAARKRQRIARAAAEIAGAILTPVQLDLLPFFKNMLATPMKEREHSQWSFGHPVLFADKPKPATPQ